MNGLEQIVNLKGGLYSLSAVLRRLILWYVLYLTFVRLRLLTDPGLISCTLQAGNRLQDSFTSTSPTCRLYPPTSPLPLPHQPSHSATA